MHVATRTFVPSRPGSRPYASVQSVAFAHLARPRSVGRAPRCGRRAARARCRGAGAAQRGERVEEAAAEGLAVRGLGGRGPDRGAELVRDPQAGGAGHVLGQAGGLDLLLAEPGLDDVHEPLRAGRVARADGGPAPGGAVDLLAVLDALHLPQHLLEGLDVVAEHRRGASRRIAAMRSSSLSQSLR